jgi:hypothetical protein
VGTAIDGCRRIFAGARHYDALTILIMGVYVNRDGKYVAACMLFL